MILRWSIGLFCAVALIAISLASGIYLSESVSTSRVNNRGLRIQQQNLEQLASSLQSPRYAVYLDGLKQNIDALQIELIEILAEGAGVQGVMSLDYDQSLIPGTLASDSGLQVTTLRLVLDMTVQHSGAVLAVIQLLTQRSGTWPRELRACNVQRLPSTHLNAQCAIDFYHWQSSDGVSE